MTGNGDRKVTSQQVYDLAAEISIAAAALIFTAEHPERWRQFVNFAGNLGGPGARETGVLTADYARGAAGRLAALASSAMRSAAAPDE